MSIYARVRRFFTLIIIGTLTAALFGLESELAQASPKQGHASQAPTAARTLPLSFIANAGQIDPSVRFQIRSRSGTLSFTPSGVTLALTHLTPNPALFHGAGRLMALSPFASLYGNGSLAARSPSSLRSGEGGWGGEVGAIHLAFDGANPNVTLDGAAPLPGIANFFSGSDPGRWHTNVPTYAQVVYHNLYPGIDLQYSGLTGTLKGTYTLAPGADPSRIRWRYTGVERVRIDSNSGDLIIRAPDGVTLSEQAPVAWQTRAGLPVPVTLGYRLESDGAIGFSVGAGNDVYDPTLPLIIDPNLVYSTYLGGSGNDQGTAIAVDSGGNAYVAGLSTGSLNTGASFPTTGSAYQPFVNGNYDAFVTKLNATGSALVYSTFLGGSGYEEASGIAVDSSGNAYIAGYTYSADFPVTSGALQAANGGGATCYNTSCADAFVTKLNPTGSSLIYSTYLGGTGFDEASGIAIDLGGGAYVTGVTLSANFPVTSSAVQRVFGGGTTDAFVAKLNSNGSALIYSTFLGGSGNDAGSAIAVDATGNAYVTGLTSGGLNGVGFPVVGGFQSTFGGGTNDAFVTKINPTGSALVYSTYLGGAGNDAGNGIALDSSGNVYVAGDTTSANFPTTSGAFQKTFGGGTNGFITKLNATGSGAVYSTYLGGNSDTQATDLALDASGSAYVTGFTSGGLPVTSQAYEIMLGGGGSDGLIVRLNAAGSALTYASYLGGAGADFAEGIALDSSNNVYVAGQTSGSFPVTAGAFQSAYGGLSADAFVSKLTLPSQPDLQRIDSIGIFRPSANAFYLRLHNSTGYADITVNYNPAVQPYPVVGDWTGSGFETIGMFDQSNGQFSLRNSNTSGPPNEQFTLGNAHDVPLAGRWTASAPHSGVGVFRPSNGLIYLRNNLSTGYADYTMVLGIPGDDGLAGNWVGGTVDSPGVYRPSAITYYLTNRVCNCAVFGDYAFQYGVSGDAPVVGDWIGQGHDGVGLFRQSNGYTYLRNALTTGFADITFVYGIAGDIPVAGHWQVVYPPVPPEHSPVPPTSAPSTGPNDHLGD